MSLAEGIEYFNSHKHLGRCWMCATCSSLYSQKRNGSHSLRDYPESIIECTDSGIFSTPRLISEQEMAKKTPSLREKITNIVNATLVYGAALYHTERELDLTRHIDTQIALLNDVYAILLRNIFRDSEKLTLVENNELIMYIELTHPIEKAVTMEGYKITHPHVWIRTCLKSYGCPHTTIPYSGEPMFIADMVRNGTVLLEENPSSKIYVKYYIDSDSYKFKRCEIDVEPM